MPPMPRPGPRSRQPRPPRRHRGPVAMPPRPATAPPSAATAVSAGCTHRLGPDPPRSPRRHAARRSHGRGRRPRQPMALPAAAAPWQPHLAAVACRARRPGDMLVAAATARGRPDTALPRPATAPAGELPQPHRHRHIAPATCQSPRRHARRRNDGPWRPRIPRRRVPSNDRSRQRAAPTASPPPRRPGHIGTPPHRLSPVVAATGHISPRTQTGRPRHPRRERPVSPLLSRPRVSPRRCRNPSAPGPSASRHPPAPPPARPARWKPARRSTSDRSPPPCRRGSRSAPRPSP